MIASRAGKNDVYTLWHDTSPLRHWYPSARRSAHFDEVGQRCEIAKGGQDGQGKQTGVL